MDNPAPNYYEEPDTAVDPYYQQKEHNVLNKLRYVAMQMWPYVNKMLNFIIYESIKLTRLFVKLVIEQLKFR